MADITPLIDRIVARRNERPSNQGLLIAISGIDASGKGYTSRLIVEALEKAGLKVAEINLDRWMNLRSVRFGQDRPGEHFYHYGFRFQELFEKLILPLKRTRSIALDAQVVEELSTEYFTKRYEFEDVDVIVLEGVFLIQPSLRDHYDLSVWVECTFETAIERAILRGQEGLPPAETVEAFETIYFPAEKYHFAVDNPKAHADLILINDPRLEAAAD